MHGSKWEWHLRNSASLKHASPRGLSLYGTGSLRHLYAANVTCSNGKAYTDRFLKISQGKGKLRRATISPHVMLTLLSPFCSPCTGGTWAWGWGWSPPPGTFFLPELPGRDPSLLAAGKPQLQGHKDDNSTHRPKTTRPWAGAGRLSFSNFTFKIRRTFVLNTQTEICPKVCPLWQTSISISSTALNSRHHADSSLAGPYSGLHGLYPRRDTVVS